MRASRFLLLCILTLTFNLIPVRLIGQTCNFAGVPNTQPGTSGTPSTQETWNPNYGGVFSICAPKTVYWAIEYTGVDYGQDFNNTTDTSAIYVIYDWGDGTVDTIKANLQNSGATLKASQKWKAVATHTYPTGDDECVYSLESYLFIDNPAAGNCTETRNEKIMTVWDTDEYKGGEVDIGEETTGTDQVLICESTDSTVTFVDQSIFNCNDETQYDGSPITNPNENKRWYQFVYGDVNTLTGSVKINDTVRTLPYYGPVQEIPYPAEEPMGTSLPVTISDSTLNGEKLSIVVRNWNTCNPYDDPLTSDPLPENDPIADTAYILIITTPPDLTGDTTDFCVNEPNISINVAPAVGGNIRWYADTKEPLDSFITEFPSPSYDFFPMSTPPAQYQLDNTTPGITKYSVTEKVGECESDPSLVTFTIREDLDLSEEIQTTNGIDICPDENGIKFYFSNNPPTKTFGGETRYIWDFPSGWTITSGDSTKEVTVNGPSTPGVYTISAYLEYVNPPICQSNVKTIDITVRPDPEASIDGDLDICAGETPTLDFTFSEGQSPFEVIYQYGADKDTVSLNGNGTDQPSSDPAAGAQTDYTLFKVTDNYGCVSTSAPEISGTAEVIVREELDVTGFSILGNTDVCEGDSNVVYTVSAGTPASQPIGGDTRYVWRERNQAGTSNEDWLTFDGSNITTNPDDTISVDIKTNIGVKTLQFNWEYVDGNCETNYVSEQVEVHDKASAELSGATTICEGDSTYLYLSITGGEQPFTVVYNDGSNQTINGAVDGDSIKVKPSATTSYQLVSITSETAPSCQGTVNVTPVKVTVNETPTGEISGNVTICEGESTDITFNFTGVGPFDVVYNDGSGDINLNGISDGHTISVSPASTTEYALVSFTSSNPPICEGTVLPDNTIEIVVDEIPTDVNAGTDSLFCGDTTSNLKALTPSPGTSSGIWSIKSKPSGAPDPNITSNVTENTDISINSGYWGDYTFEWTVTNGVCDPVSDSVTYNFGQNPDDPDAHLSRGRDTSTCMPEFDLVGNNPSFGDVEWIASDPSKITFDDSSQATTNVTASEAGTYKFYWTISSGNCPVEKDSTIVEFFVTPVSDAGADSASCSQTYQLIANADTGNGSWSLISKPGGTKTTSDIVDRTNDTAQITVDAFGTYTFQWKEVEGVCSDSATVDIAFYEQPVADAGTDDEVCDQDVTLDATTSSGSGVWSKIDGTGTANFINPNNEDTDVEVSNFGVKQFEWLETNGICTDRDTVEIGFFEQPSAMAGPDIDICNDTSVTLDGSGYNYSTDGDDEKNASRTWSWVSGPDNSPDYADPTDPKTTIDVKYFGEYEFNFIETNGSICDNFDEVKVGFYEQPIADAGSDKEVCNAKSTTLDGTAYTYLGDNHIDFGNIQWEYVSGPDAAPVFGTPNSASTNVTVTLFGEYEFRILETNGTCSDADTITVTFYQQPTAEAGPALEICDNKTIELQGTAFSYDGGSNEDFGTILWEYVSGPDATPVFDDDSDPTTNVTVGEYGEYVFRITETNGTCTSDDVVTVNFYEKPSTEAGDTIEVCNALNTNLNATAHTYDPFPAENNGTSTWKFVSGPDNTPTFINPSLPNTNVSVNNYGEYEFRFVEENGTCNDSDLVVVYFYQQPDADAGSDGNACDVLNYSLNATEFGYSATPNENFGENYWSLESGPGSVSSWGSGIGEPDPTITVTAYGEYVFIWTEENGTCVSRDTITVNFYQSPSAIAGTDGISCQGYDFDFSTLTTKPIAGSYDSLGWQITGGSGTNIGGGTILYSDSIYPTYQPASDETGDVIFELTAYGQGSCSDATDVMTLSIKPSPQTSAISGDEDVCVSTQEVYQVTSHSGSTYDWTLDDASGIAPDLTPIGNKVILEFSGTAWSGKLRVVETSSNGCVGDTVKKDIQSYQVPTVDAGMSITLCAGQTDTLGGSPTATGGSGSYSYAWSPGTGLDDQLVAHPEVSIPYSQNYSLQVTDAVSGCVAPSDVVSVTVNPVPDAPTTTSEEVCFGETTPALTASGDSLKWYSDPGLTNQVGAGTSYTPTNTAVDSYTYYVTQKESGCVSDDAEATLTILELPVIDSTQKKDQTICNSNDGSITIYATGASLEYSINGGTNWQASNNFINLGNADYPIAVRNGLGCVVYGDTIEIAGGDPPDSPVAGGGNTYCEGESLNDLTAVKQSGGTLTWYSDPSLLNDIGTGTTLSPTDDLGTSTYYVTETAGGCESAASTVSVTINEIPDTPVADDVSVCQGDSVPALTATGSNVEWHETASLSTVLETGNTYETGQTTGSENYYVTQTVSGCQSAANEVTLQIKTKPAQLSVANDEICYGESNPTFSAAGNDVKWYSLPDSALTGSGGDFTPADDTVNAYNFYVTQTVSGCSSDPEDFTYTIKPIPDAPASRDTFACEYDSPKPKLSATGDAGSTIKWYEDDGTFITSGASPHTLNITHNLVDTTNYRVTQVVDGCESDYEETQIIIYGRPLQPTVSDTTICEGETALLTAHGEKGGTLVWYNQFGSIALDTGTYFYTGDTAVGDPDYSIRQENNSCESFLKGVTVTINPSPVISNVTSVDETSCDSKDGEITITASSKFQTSNTLDYSNDGGISFNSNEGEFEDLSNGLYPIAVKNLYSCITLGDTAIISDGGAPSPPVAGDDTVYCQGNSYEKMFASNSVGGTLTWYSNPTLTNVIVNGSLLEPYDSTGTRNYYVTEKSGVCESTPSIVTITIDPLPTAEISGSTEICEGDSAQVTINMTGEAPFSLTYTDGSQNTTINTSNNTYAFYTKKQATYTLVSMSDNNGCSADSLTGQAEIIVNDNPNTTISPLSPASVCKNADLQLNGNPGGGAGGFTHQWTGQTTYLSETDTVAPVFNASLTGNYQLSYQVTDINGCQANDSITIEVNKQPAISISPSGPEEICENTQLQLEATATGGTPAYTFQWSGDSSGISNAEIYNPTFTDTSGEYTLLVRVSDQNGCAGTDSVTVIVNETPAAPVVSDATVCYGSANPPLTATGSNIKWYSNSSLTSQVAGTNAFTPVDSLAGDYDYYATQTLGTCESEGSEATLTIRPLPQITSQTASDQTVCDSKDGAITIVASGAGPLEYSIDDGTTWESDGNFTGLSNAFYEVAVRNVHGCVKYGKTLQIQSGDQPGPPDAGNDATYCYGETPADLNAQTKSGGTLRWYKDANLTDTLAENVTTFTPLNTVDTTRYYVTETAGGCESEPAIVTIVIHPVPSIPTATDKSVCSSEPIPNLTASGQNIQWYTDSLTNLQFSGSSFNTGETTAGVYPYYVSQTINGCESPGKKVALTIKATPTQLSVNDSTICFGETTPTFSASGSNVLWYQKSDSSVVGSGTNFKPNEDQPDTYSYFVTQTDDGCPSPQENFDLVINPLPGKPVSEDVSACEGNVPNLIATGDAGSDIDWYEGSTHVDDGSTFNHGKSAVGTYDFFVTQTVDGCESAKLPVTLEINPIPAAPTAADEVGFCEGEDPILTASGGAGASFKWFNNDGDSINIGNSIRVEDTTLGNLFIYSVTQTIKGCESPEKSIKYIIYDVIEINDFDTITGSNCVLNNGKIIIEPDTNFVYYSIGGDYKYQQNEFTNLSNGLYPLSTKREYSTTPARTCYFYGDTAELIDKGAPDAPEVSPDKTYCEDDFRIQMSAKPSSGGDINWYLNPNLDSSIHTGTIKDPIDSLATVTYYVTEKGSDECESSPSEINITIHPLPSSLITGDTSICTGDSALITVELEGEPGFSFNYTNNSGQFRSVSTSDTIYEFKTNTSGIYEVISLSDNTGCFAKDMDGDASVVINPLPIPNISPKSPASICKESTIQLNGNPVFGAAPYTHQWTGDTSLLSSSVIQQPVFAGDLSGDYRLYYEVTDSNKCSASDSIDIEVFKRPSVTLLPGDPAFVCAGNGLQLEAVINGGTPNYQHTWSGAIAYINNRYIQNPTVNAPEGTHKYYYKVTDKNTCQNNDSLSVIVSSVTVDIFPDTIEVYSNQDTLIEGNPMGGSGSYTHTWSGNINFIDNPSTENVTFNSDVLGSHKLIYEAEDNASGCSDKDSLIIRVFGNPTTSISPKPASICAGGEVILRSNTTDGLTPYAHHWTGDNQFLNDTLSDKVTFSSSVPGTYTVYYTVTDARGKTDKDSVSVTVHELPEIAMADTFHVCKNGTVQLTNSISGGSGTYTQFRWRKDKVYLNDTTLQQPIFNSFIAQTYTSILKVTDDRGCANFDTTKIVNHALPVPDFTPSPDKGCSPLEVSMNNTSTDAVTYIWKYGDGEYDSTNTEEPTHTFANNQATNQNMSIKLITTSDQGCIDSTEKFVEVYAEQDAPITISDSSIGCSPFTVLLVGNEDVNNIQSYLWKFGDGQISTQPSDYHTYTNNSFDKDTSYIVTLERTTVYGCFYSVKDTITVHSLPDAYFEVDTNFGCSPFAVEITNASSSDVIENIWDFGDGNVDTNNSGSLNYEYELTGPSTKIFTLELTVWNDHCSDKSSSFFQVYPQANVNITPGDTGWVCEAGELQLNGNPSGGTQPFIHTWDGDIANLNSDKVVNPVFSGTKGEYQLQYSLFDANRCLANDSIVINVERVETNILPDTIQIYENDDTLVNGHPSGAIGDYVHTWESDLSGFTDPGDSLVAFSSANEGRYQLKYTALDASLGCEASDSVIIIVHEKPNVTLSPDPAIACESINLNITAAITGGIKPYTIDWSGDTASFKHYTDTTAIFANSSAGSYTIVYSLTDATGEVSTDQLNITVNPNPEPSLADSAFACAKSTLPLQGSPSGGSETYAQHTWTGDIQTLDNAALENPEFRSNAPGTYELIYQVTDDKGCKGPDTIIVTNHALPQPAYLSNPPQGCSPLSVDFTNQSTNAVSYDWHFGDGPVSTDENPSHLFTNNTDKNQFVNVKLVATSDKGCLDSTTKSITVFAEKDAPIIADDTIGCSPVTVNFTGQMNGVSSTGYEWDFGDGSASNSPNPSHIFENNMIGKDTTYEVTLTRTSDDNCVYRVRQNITVRSIPVADFTLEENLGCSPFQVQATNNSSDDMLQATWRFGNGETLEDTAANINYTYENDGTNADFYNLELTVSNGNCSSSATEKVSVYPYVEAAFEPDMQQGCAPLNVVFNNNSQGIKFNESTWDFGDGRSSTDYNPNHEFFNNTINDTIFDVKLKVRSGFGCADSVVQPIIVYASPEAEFDVNPTYQVYPEKTVELENQTIPGDWEYEWNFDDGNKLTDRQPQTYEYDTSGIYDIMLKVFSAVCSDSTISTVRVALPPPIVNFDSIAEGCAPHTIQPGNNSLYAEEYEWDFGDGRKSEVEDPTHTYLEPDTFILRLTAKGEGGTSSFNRQIVVHPVPNAFFKVAPNNVYVKEQSVRFFNLTEQGDSYLWHFGDDSSSTGYQPTKRYYETGLYDVRLEAWNDEGCYDEYVLEKAVKVEARDKFKFPTAFKPNPGGPTGGQYTPGDGRNNVFYPAFVEGIEDYKLEIYNRWGVIVFVSEDIDVGWDGYDQDGKLVKSDTYIWKVTGKFTNGKTYEQVGEVTILR